MIATGPSTHLLPLFKHLLIFTIHDRRANKET